MTPLETIKEGILNGDLAMVIAGYNRITGETLAIPEPEPAVRQPPRGFRQSPEYYDEEDDFSRPPNRDRERNNDEPEQKVVARAEPFVPRKRINMFADERDTLPDYTEADRRKDEAAKKKPKAQRPAPYTPVKASCDGCGNRFQVNPIFVVDGVYRCDKCSGRKR